MPSSTTSNVSPTSGTNSMSKPEEPPGGCVDTPSSHLEYRSSGDNAWLEPICAEKFPESRPGTSGKKSSDIVRTRSQNGYGCDNETVDEAAPSEDPWEVKWQGGVLDPLNPKAMPALKKWVMVLIVSSASLCVTFASSIYSMIYHQLTKEFHCSKLIATLGLSTFVAGLGLGPMLLGPLSEFYGRRPIYIWSFGFFLIWLFGCAFAQNIQTMIICRFFDGFAGSAFLSVAGGTVSDLFERSQLHAPMMIYTASPFLGPALGPLIGGFVNTYLSWRWTFYILCLWAGATLVLIIILVPETYHPIILRRKAERLRKETGDERWRAPMEKSKKSIPKTIKMSLYRPLQLLLLEPMCLNLCLYAAILLGILYLFFGAFSLVFGKNHDFDLSQVGLSFLGLACGMVIAILSDPLWHKNYVRLVRNREKAGGETGGSDPEYR